ncbi:hypothetical protein D3C81_624520 [compost metagenome]
MVQAGLRTLPALDDARLGLGHARQLHVAFGGQAGNRERVTGLGIWGSALAQQLVRGTQVPGGLFVGRTAACAQCSFFKQDQKSLAVIGSECAWAGALKLIGDLEDGGVQLITPDLAHGLGDACMLRRSLARGCERVGRIEHAIMGETHALLAGLQKA